MKSQAVKFAAALLLVLPFALFGQAYEAELPVYLQDRGSGMPTSMFGTYVHKGELLFYPFWEYYYNPDEEYKPEELGYGVDKDFRSEFRANERLIFAVYGVTDRLNLEVEAAQISAELNKSPDDPSSMPSELEESGLGDVQTQFNFYWRPETERGLGAWSYFETVYPFNKDKALTGTADFEFKLGQGIARGFSWGTMFLRAGAEYSLDENKGELGEIALEYLRRLNKSWRVYTGVEGVQDEWELITEAQYHLVKDRLFFKFNNAFGLTSKAPDWAPEYGIMIGF